MTQMDFSKILERTMQKAVKPSEPSPNKDLAKMTPEELQEDIYDCYQCGPPKTEIGEQGSLIPLSHRKSGETAHLSPPQQEIMHAALRDSLKIIDPPKREMSPWEKDYIKEREKLKPIGDYVRKVEEKLGRDAHFSMCAEMFKESVSVDEAVKRMQAYFKELYKNGEKRRHF